MTQLGLQPGIPRGQINQVVSLAEDSRLDPILCLVDQGLGLVSCGRNKHFPPALGNLSRKSERRPSSFQSASSLSRSVQTISVPPSQSRPGLPGPAGFITILECKVCTVHRTMGVGMCGNVLDLSSTYSVMSVMEHMGMQEQGAHGSMGHRHWAVLTSCSPCSS